MVQSNIAKGDSLESRRPCALQACRSQTDLAPQSRKSGTQERVRRTAYVPDFPGGLGDCQSGGVVPATQAVNVFRDCRIRQIRNVGTVQGGDTKTKESRAVSPRMGFPPWWISF